MKGKRRTRSWEAPLVAALSLAACVGLSASTASAKYLWDGAVPDGIGGWKVPHDGICIVGVKADGTLVVDTTITTKRDCAYYTTGLTSISMADVTSLSVCGSGGTSACNSSTNCKNTNINSGGTLTWNATDSKCYDSAPCTIAGATGNDGSKHALATSICVDGSGNGKGLAGLDRSAAICIAKGYNWKQTSATPPAGVSGTFPTAGFGGACAAYGWNYRGIDGTGTPLAFDSTPGTGKGTTAAANTGFCYAKIDTGLTAATTCPSVVGSSAGTKTASSSAAFGYTAGTSAPYCTYDYGITGKAAADMYTANGTRIVKGTVVDFSATTTMGDCFANGGSWANWVRNNGTGLDPVGGTATIATFDFTTQGVATTEGCLHCHTYTDQYNGPTERFKESYLKTGHKNMLRKVTPGQPWAGPCVAGDIPNADGLCVYTTDGTNTINFMTSLDPFAKATVAGVDQNLYYIYGDWMIRNPSLVYGTNGYGSAPGATNGYSCYACHATGSKDSSLTCTVNPSINTTAALCTAAGGTMTAPAVPGVQSIGTPGYSGVQPQASFPGISINAANPKWDLEGITCGRCHNVTVPSVTQTQISGGTCKNGATDVTSFYPTQAACTAATYTWTSIGTASSFPTTAPTSGGMGALASGTGRNNLCFGCHQSIAKLWPAGTNQLDPTLIPTGVSHGAAAGRDFNGHVLGNSFLNSVHAQYAGAQSGNGSITINSLGKYDLTDPNGTSEYGSIFKGYTCWQGTTSNSPGKTKPDGTEIKTKSDCESLYGAGSWRADQDGSTAATSIQGTCTTCHDVHNSLFIDTQQEAALRKKCDDCHVNNSITSATDAAAPQVNLATIGHPTGGGTPFDSTKYESACVVCHMATQAEANGNQTSMPVHVWRINTNASYSTFPTTGQFYGGSCSVHTGAIQNAPALPVVYLSDTSSANCTGASPAGIWTAVPKDRNAQVAPDGTYANAVWVDLDLACGQCHGGSLGAAATVNNAPYLTKAQLATYAAGIHNNGPISVNFGYSLGSPNTLAVTVYAAADCGGPCGAFDWDWGDGTAHGSGASASHIYAGAGMYAVTLTVTGNGQNASKTKNVNVYTPDDSPTVSGTACGTILNANTWSASLTDTSSDNEGVSHVTVNWGDGSLLAQGAQGVTLTHTYRGPGTYTITHKALDTIGQQAVRTCTVSVAYFTIGGTVQALDSTLTPPATVNVPSATVTVTNAGGVVVRKVYTAIDGTFSAGSLKPGTYTLSVAKGGYTFPAVAPITVGPSSTSNSVTGTKP
ncbi:MAG: PKD domain-containing protein [Candidatus Binatia bacterium]